MYSIVIPTKNEEKHIGGLLESIKAQTVQPKEVIVADKSTDKTREIARKYGVLVVEGQDDGRVGLARNKGAKHVTSEIIVFMDGDVELPHPKFIEIVLNSFKQRKLDIASCYYAPVIRNFKGDFAFAFINLAKRFDSIIKKGFSTGGGFIMVKTKVFKDAGKFREDICVSEDLEFTTRVVRKGYRFGLVSIRIKVSSRRFTKASFGSMIVAAIGGISALIGNVVGTKWFKDRRKTFEKMYGELGGGLDEE